MQVSATKYNIKVTKTKRSIWLNPTNVLHWQEEFIETDNLFSCVFELIVWKKVLCKGATALSELRAMFVMVMSVRTKAVAETVSKAKEINISHKNNLSNINCINHLDSVIGRSDCVNSKDYCASIDKTIKHILPIPVDTATILSPSTLTSSAQPAQNPNKYLITELNNIRQPPTIQVNPEINFLAFQLRI